MEIKVKFTLIEEANQDVLDLLSDYEIVNDNDKFIVINKETKEVLTNNYNKGFKSRHKAAKGAYTTIAARLNLTYQENSVIQK